MKKMKQLKNKRVLVTGASSGIGFQIAKDFLEEGAIVGAHYCGNRKSAEKLLSFAGKNRCRLFQADFAFSGEVMRLWNEFRAWTKGEVDILINNAGQVTKPMGIEKLSEEVWDRTFQINVKAPFLLARSALSLMKKKRLGRIINISSIGVKFGGSSNTAHYSASKAALEAIGKSLAKAGAGFNVLVNTVRAGVTDTPLHRKIGRLDLSARISLIPLKRLASPKEISNVVLFLAGEKSSFITGTVIDVAGGE